MTVAELREAAENASRWAILGNNGPNGKKNNMKNSIIFLTLLMGLQVVSQNINRVEVKGRIIVESSDLIGITVLNTTTNVGTITNEMGEFWWWASYYRARL